jgi:hypothetical protein
MHNDQPFLFWTLVVIVSSRLSGNTYGELYDHLQDPYTQLLKDELVRAPMPLHNIQALVFLCMWPLPVTFQAKDPSWLYCGVAMQAARYMGLDKEQRLPSFRALGVVSGSSQARINTWLGCFYVSTS